MCLMTLGPVLMNSGCDMRNQAARMRSDTRTAVKNLHSHCRVARLQLLADELIRHAVVMPLDLSVIVDIGANDFH